MMLTPSQIKIQDNATIHLLAGAMVSVLALAVANRVEDVAVILPKIDALLKQDPNFLSRFNASQDAAMEAYNQVKKITSLVMVRDHD